MNFEDLTPEQQAKARACTSPEEILALAREEGYELTDDELAAVSGGGIWDCFGNCPNHKSIPHCSGLSR